MEKNKFIDLEANYENLIEYFDSISNGLIKYSINEYVTIIKKYRKQFFEFNNEIRDIQLSKKIVKAIYLNINTISGHFINNKNYIDAAKLLHKLELDMQAAESNKLLKYLWLTEYYYDLAYLLNKTDDDYEAIIKCEVILSEYILKRKTIYELIINEEEDTPKDTTDYSIYLNHLILLSKLAQSICKKVGLSNEYGKFYFREKLLTERLLYRCEIPPYVYQMVTLRGIVSESDIPNTGVTNERSNKKGFDKFKIKLRYIRKGFVLTVWRILTGFGEKPFRLIIYSLFIIVIWSILYALANTSLNNSFYDYFYHSLLTFTSFGFYGNFIIDSAINRILISTEIIAGIIFMNGFIVTLARKYLR